MTTIDVISGFLGAGKTTLIRKLLKEALHGQKIVLIENEFGDIGIDGGFLQEAGIEIKEMNSGCICCSLVGDFGESLKEVLSTYKPERIIIEPSGVGKLSDVLAAIQNVEAQDELVIGSAVTVIDANKCKLYNKNFGEFFKNQVTYADCLVLSRTSGITDTRLQETLEILRSLNPDALIVTTPWDQIEGADILEAIQARAKLEERVHKLVDAMEDVHEHTHEHCDHDHGSCVHEHEEHDHEHCDHDHEIGDYDDHDHNHDHTHHSHDHDHTHDHAHDHTHDHDHDHAHHHADEIFDAWGVETPMLYDKNAVEEILTQLDSGNYGNVLRAKGMLPAVDGTWIYFDYVPGERFLRNGKAQVTGKICVIGESLQAKELQALFRQTI
jgi:G3E family GTPase